MKYLFANWKMYLDYGETRTLARELVKAPLSSTENLTIGVFPSALGIADVADMLKESPIAVGAQNVAWVPKGAYTGAVSALMYKDIGARFALVGHSERRYIFGETNEAVQKKCSAAIDAGLVPVVCIGETKEDREDGKREYRLKKQLMKVFEGYKNNTSSSCIIAYEPVWAIGTGEPCDPVEVAEIHQFIKQEVREYLQHVVPVIYGGSVDEKNVVSYLSLDPIDGVLVGKASTHADVFFQMISLAQTRF